MHILMMVILFYSTNGVTAERIREEYTSKANCETAVQVNAAALKKTGEEGKVVLATCTEK